MLLFIQIVICDNIPTIYFNTSHVTVYRLAVRPKKVSSLISIHLMLLFIYITLREIDEQ